MVIGNIFTVGFGAALITGGASLALTAGTLGTLYGVGGTAVNVGTSIVDHVQTKDFIKKINTAMTDLQAALGTLESTLDNYNETLEYLKEMYKLDDNEAWTMTNQFYAMSNNLKKGVEQMGSVAIFVVVLAMAKPCFADTAILTPLAHNLVHMVGTIPSMSNLAPKFANTAGQFAGRVAGQSLFQIGGGTAGMTASMVRNGGLVMKTGKVLKGVLAGVNIAVAVWEVYSLVKDWNTAHPAVDAINTVTEKLDQVEIQIKEQLQLLKKCDFQQTETTEEDEEDQEKVRIYDTSPLMMKWILNKAGIIASPSDDYRGKSSSWLMSEIQQLKTMAEEGTFCLSSYFQLIDYFQELLSSCSHEIKFKKDVFNSSNLTLYSASKIIVFDEEWRNYMQDLLLPIHSIVKIPLAVNSNVKEFCCVYQVRCVVCCEFHYVGQARNFPGRHKQHAGSTLTGWIDRENLTAAIEVEEPIAKEELPSRVLSRHLAHHEIAEEKFGYVYEIDIVHRFSDSTDATLHNWKTLDQWLLEEDAGSRHILN